MKCYRVYSNGECVGTFFNIVMDLNHQQLFLSSGCNATVEIENY